MSDSPWPAETGYALAEAEPVDALSAWLWRRLPLQSLRIHSSRAVLKMSGDYIDYVIELLGPFGTVSARPMFGGHGIYLDGLMFALVSDDMLYLKSDEMNRREFEQAGCEIFSYARKGKRATIGFFSPPEEALESPEMMLPWARTAYAAALRARARSEAEALRADAKAKPPAGATGTRKSPRPVAAKPAMRKAAVKRPPARPVRAKPARKPRRSARA
jgi:DNA transformation protein and related proteins